jgi:hypothetical protein
MLTASAAIAQLPAPSVISVITERRVVSAWPASATQPAAPSSTALATTRFETTGWATFGLALPIGAAKDGVRVGNLVTQTDVKTRWPDGSIRFAVVTARAAASGTAHISAGALESGTVTPTPLSATTRLTIAGELWTAALPSTRGDRWLSGPHAVEDRALVAPLGKSGAHPFLRVRYDVRSYAGGGHRVDVSVENMLDVAATDVVDYDVAIDVDGVPVFKQAKVRHYAFTRWRQVFHTKGLTEAVVTPDAEPFIRAHAVPRYLPSVLNSRRSIGGERFGILRHGDLAAYMGEAGTRPELSLYPDWTAQFLVHRTRSQRDYVLRHGELAGSWAVHITSDGTTPISLDARPNFWFDQRGNDKPANNLRGRPEAVDASSQPDNAHQPSLAYIPYLVTGDRWFADEMRFWANYCLIRQWPEGRWYGAGVMFAEEVRGRGHALRNLSDAAAYLPDDDPFKAYFRQRVLNNLNAFDGWVKSEAPQAPLTGGAVVKYDSFRDEHPPYWSIPIWQEYQLAWALDHAIAHGDYPAGAGTAMRDAIVRFCLRTLTSPDYPREWAGPYKMALGTYTNGVYTHFQAMKDVLDGTKVTNGPAPTPLTGDWYGVQIRLMMLIAKRIGMDVTKADESLKWLMGRGGDERMTETVNRRSGYAIAP